MFEQAGMKQVIESQGKEVALFTLLEHFPFGGVMSLIAIVLIATFFITSADSATFVLGTLTSNGNLNPSERHQVYVGNCPISRGSRVTVVRWAEGPSNGLDPCRVSLCRDHSVLDGVPLPVVQGRGARAGTYARPYTSLSPLSQGLLSSPSLCARFH